jgi:hypothetical protein
MKKLILLGVLLGIIIAAAYLLRYNCNRYN